MREIKFKYLVKLGDTEGNRIMSFIFSLEDLENTIDVMDLLADKISEALTSEICDCNINESNTEHDCYYDWDYDFEVISRLQYTGLKDKSKKEMYDGDIVCNEGIRNIISWDKFYGWVVSEEQMLGEVNFAQIEVIGNIYENPELLK